MYSFIAEQTQEIALTNVNIVGINSLAGEHTRGFKKK